MLTHLQHLGPVAKHDPGHRPRLARLRRHAHVPPAIHAGAEEVVHAETVLDGGGGGRRGRAGREGGPRDGDGADDGLDGIAARGEETVGRLAPRLGKMKREGGGLSREEAEDGWNEDAVFHGFSFRGLGSHVDGAQSVL